MKKQMLDYLLFILGLHPHYLQKVTDQESPGVSEKR
jgi:hypothetical protein